MDKDIICVINTEFGKVTYYNPSFELLKDWHIVLNCNFEQFFLKQGGM